MKDTRRFINVLMTEVQEVTIIVLPVIVVVVVVKALVLEIVENY